MSTALWFATVRLFATTLDYDKHLSSIPAARNAPCGRAVLNRFVASVKGKH
jgi:hypothetical protein